MAEEWDDESICGQGCYFDPYDDDPAEESYHFKRICDGCGEMWYSLHCVHDGIQNPCPNCGWRPPSTRTAAEALGFLRPPG